MATERKIFSHNASTFSTEQNVKMLGKANRKTESNFGQGKSHKEVFLIPSAAVQSVHILYVYRDGVYISGDYSIRMLGRASPKPPNQVAVWQLLILIFPPP